MNYSYFKKPNFVFLIGFFLIGIYFATGISPWIGSGLRFYPENIPLYIIFFTPLLVSVIGIMILFLDKTIDPYLWFIAILWLVLSGHTILVRSPFNSEVVDALIVFIFSITCFFYLVINNLKNKKPD